MGSSVSRGPRIRTLKPENWQDEAVGRLSHQARLLRDVLITYADDDGRWRHLASAIIGHGYPYDELSPSKLKQWAGELVREGLVVLYTVDGCEYGCFPTWHLHQKINRYTPSRLPACDDPRVISLDRARQIAAAKPNQDQNLTESSPTTQGFITEGSSPTRRRADRGRDPYPDQSRRSRARKPTAPCIQASPRSSRSSRPPTDRTAGSSSSRWRCRR
jgi:hypothetical protein